MNINAYKGVKIIKTVCKCIHNYLLNLHYILIHIHTWLDSYNTSTHIHVSTHKQLPRFLPIHFKSNRDTDTDSFSKNYSRYCYQNSE